MAALAARSSAEADAEALSPLGFVFFQMLLSFTAKGPMHSSASCDVCKEGSSSTHRIKPRGTGHELWIPAVSFFFCGFFLVFFFSSRQLERLNRNEELIGAFAWRLSELSPTQKPALSHCPNERNVL